MLKCGKVVEDLLNTALSDGILLDSQFRFLSQELIFVHKKPPYVSFKQTKEVSDSNII